MRSVYHIVLVICMLFSSPLQAVDRRLIDPRWSFPASLGLTMASLVSLCACWFLAKNIKDTPVSASTTPRPSKSNKKRGLKLNKKALIKAQIPLIIAIFAGIILTFTEMLARVRQKDAWSDIYAKDDRGEYVAFVSDLRDPQVYQSASDAFKTIKNAYYYLIINHPNDLSDALKAIKASNLNGWQALVNHIYSNESEVFKNALQMATSSSSSAHHTTRAISSTNPLFTQRHPGATHHSTHTQPVAT